MSIAIAFDIYGTLINPHGVVTELAHHLGDRAQPFSNLWRDKQLEYSFRRGLMGCYQNFPVCTRQALDYADAVMQTGLDESVKAKLMALYGELPAFDDVAQSLEAMSREGWKLYAFSNGTADAVNGLLQSAGIDHHFAGVVSVDALQTFKPDPRVYRYFMETADTDAERCWLVSSNPFDVIGAVAAGMQAAWLQRTPTAVFDPWELQPSCKITRLDELKDSISN